MTRLHLSRTAVSSPSLNHVLEMCLHCVSAQSDMFPVWSETTCCLQPADVHHVDVSLKQITPMILTTEGELLQHIPDTHRGHRKLHVPPSVHSRLLTHSHLQLVNHMFEVSQMMTHLVRDPVTAWVPVRWKANPSDRTPSRGCECRLSHSLPLPDLQVH